MNQAAIKFRGGTMAWVGPDGTTKQMGMTMNRYLVELHCSSYGNHKTGRVVRSDDRCIMCVCVYKRGAFRVCDELNALATGKMGVNHEGDQYAK